MRDLFQPLALHVANSVFVGDYLTSEGQEAAADLAMIADAGFLVEGRAELANAAGPDLVVPRRRGPGTNTPANA